MASTRLDLPAPVGPVSANRSAPSKSTTVGSRNAVNPSTSSRLGRMRRIQEIGEQGLNSRVLDPPLGEVLAEQLLRRAAGPPPAIDGRPRVPRTVRILHDDIDGLGEKGADVVGQPRSDRLSDHDLEVVVADRADQLVE